MSVAEAYHDGGRAKIATLKVLYLLAVTAVTFIVPAFLAAPAYRWFVVAALLALQIFMLLAARIRARELLRPVWRLKWLFLFLAGCYAFLPPEDPVRAELLDWRIPGVHWTLSINLTGLERAGLMCLQIITLLLASALVRLTGTGRDLVEGLQAFRLPLLFVYSLDHTLELLGGGRPPGDRRGDGRHSTSARPGLSGVLKRLMRGDFKALVESIRRNIELAGGQTAREVDSCLDVRLAHDVAVVSGIALCMASFKVLRILPGLPFASGHKAILLFPLYVLASRLTHSRWGGTAAGSIMGVIGFLQGDGRFGVLEIFKHLAPGLVIDLGDPLVRRLPSWALGYCLLGLVAAIARSTTEWVIVFLLGARAEVYIFPAAKMVPNLMAGFLSGFVTMFVLRAFERSPPSGDKPVQGGDAQARRTPDRAGGAEVRLQYSGEETGPRAPPAADCPTEPRRADSRSRSYESPDDPRGLPPRRI